MTIAVEHPLVLRWRTLEWVGVGLALFLQTGALLPVLLMDANGELDGPARSTLQQLQLPGYAIAVMLIARHPGQFLVALWRNLPLVILLGLAFASVLWSISPSVTLRRSVALFFSTALAFVIAVRFTPRQLLVLAGAVLGSCMVLSLIISVAAPRLGWADTGEMRGAFLNKNVLGWYAVFSSLVFFAMAADERFRRRRIALLFGLLSVACLLGSESMTATAALIFAVGFAGFFTLLRRLRGIARVVLILVVLLAFTAVGSLDLLVLLLEASGKDATLTGRVPLWSVVDEEIARRPLLGYGYQAFWTEASGGAWRIWQKIDWMAPHAHNGFRDTVLSLGIVGLALLFVTIARSAYYGVVLLCRAPGQGWFWINVLLGVFLTMNLTETLLLVQNDFLFTLFAAALVMCTIRGVEFQRHGLPWGRWAPAPVA